MFGLIFMVLRRLLTARIWFGLILMVFVVLGSVFFADWVTSVFVFLTVVPLWMFYTAVCLVIEAKTVKNELVSLAAGINVESIKNGESRQKTIQSVCDLGGFDPSKPMVANCVLNAILAAKRTAKSEQELTGAKEKL